MVSLDIFTQRMSNSTRDGDADTSQAGPPKTDDHLSDVEDGCGCVEIWERLSEQRASD
jgi:hypothetical protein